MAGAHDVDAVEGFHVAMSDEGNRGEVGHLVGLHVGDDGLEPLCIEQVAQIGCSQRGCSQRGWSHGRRSLGRPIVGRPPYQPVHLVTLGRQLGRQVAPGEDLGARDQNPAHAAALKENPAS